MSRNLPFDVACNIESLLTTWSLLLVVLVIAILAFVYDNLISVHQAINYSLVGLIAASGAILFVFMIYRLTCRDEVW